MDNRVIDNLDRHWGQAGGPDRAAMIPGIFLAWCANMRCLAAQIEREHEVLLLRVRVREAKGSDLLVACGGELTEDMLSDAGVRFARSWYQHYLDLWRSDPASTASELGSGAYQQEDNWDTYDRFAVALTKAYMGASTAGRANAGGRLRGWVKTLFGRADN